MDGSPVNDVSYLERSNYSMLYSCGYNIPKNHRHGDQQLLLLFSLQVYTVGTTFTCSYDD